MTDRNGLLIVADDLSGAAETAAAVAGGSVAQVWLGHPLHFDAPIVAVDTGARSSREVGSVLSAALEHVPDGASVYKKVDSLLRGSIRAELQVLRDRGLPVVVVMAVPRIGRTVRGGVVHLGEVPLHESDAWDAEDGPVPRSVPDALGVPCVVLPATVVRSGALGNALMEALAEGLVPVCDSETESDLDVIAETLMDMDPRIVVAGSAGLARSMSAHMDLHAMPRRFTPGADRVIAIVGSRAASAQRQVARLIAEGVKHVEMWPGRPTDLPWSDVVVTLSVEPPWDHPALDAAYRALVHSIRAHPGRTDLLLTGGDTARRVLDALGVRELFTEGEIHDGAVLSTTAAGMALVTRPGSYGADDSLMQIVRHLKGIDE